MIVTDHLVHVPNVRNVPRVYVLDQRRWLLEQLAQEHASVQALCFRILGRC